MFSVVYNYVFIYSVDIKNKIYNKLSMYGNYVWYVLK